jgi:peptidyl-prolyl cis-trans isomerase B (cyclophilin B)
MHVRRCRPLRGTHAVTLARLRSIVSTVTITITAACILAMAHAGPPPSSVPTQKHNAPAPDPRIQIVIANRGTIVAVLFPKKNPKTTAHILALVRKKFYDHLLFHSVTKGFMAVTGDPKSRTIDGAKIAKLSDMEVIEKYRLGSGGSGSSVPLEPGGTHLRGTLGLLRSERNINSGDSQFFFNLQDNMSNDVIYCVFGVVVQGLDVMDKISQGDRITSIRIVSAPLPAYAQPPPKH